MSGIENGRAFDANAVRACVQGQLIGSEIIHLERTGSTNDVVMDTAVAGAHEGLVVFAEEQTAGRGQYGRAWNSAAGKGLWFSILLRPNLPLADSTRLTDWLAHTVASTIAQEFGLAPTVKQPNDIYIGEKKVAGILVEMRALAGEPHAAIAGIGLNVNQTLKDFPGELRDTATSVRIATGQAAARTELAVALLRALDSDYRKRRFLTP